MMQKITKKTLYHGASRECNTPIIEADKSARSSDRALKDYAFQQPIMSFRSAKCGKNCPYGGKCIQNTPIEVICNARDWFWGAAHEPAPKTKTRKEKIFEFLRTAYSANEQRFAFVVLDPYDASDKRLVCEVAFLYIIGLSLKSRVSEAPGQYLRCRDCILQGRDIPESKYNRPTLKYDHARAYIVYTAGKVGDTTAYGGKNIVLPQGIILFYLFICCVVT